MRIDSTGRSVTIIHKGYPGAARSLRNASLVGRLQTEHRRAPLGAKIGLAGAR